MDPNQANNTNPTMLGNLISRFEKLTPARKLLAILIPIILVVSLVLLINRARNLGDFSVAENIAAVSLVPSTSNLTPGSTQNVVLKAHTGGRLVDGFQVFVDITGSLPSNLTFTPANLSAQGLKQQVSTLTDIAGTKQLQLLFITNDPQVPFQSANLIDLGTFTFTSPASGQMNMAFNVTNTKIIENNTLANLVTPPAASVYTFANPVSSIATTTSTPTVTTIPVTSVTTVTSVATSTPTTSTPINTTTTSSLATTTSAVAQSLNLRVSTTSGTTYSEGPISLGYNFGMRLQWQVTGTFTSCTATSTPSNSQWNGSLSVNGGYKDIVGMTQSTTFVVTCGTLTDSVVVNVIQPTTSTAPVTTTSAVATTTSAPISSTPVTSSPTVAVCGNNVIEGAEVCDDGNTSNYDQCSNTCSATCQTGSVWNGAKCVQVACRSDYDRTGVVDAPDFLKFATNYKKTGISCDLDIVGGNCYLDAADFLQFAQIYKKPNICN